MLCSDLGGVCTELIDLPLVVLKCLSFGLTVSDLLLDFANEIHQDGFVPAWKGLLQSTMKKSSFKVVVKAATRTLGMSKNEFSRANASEAHLVSMHPGTLSRKTISFEVTSALESIEGHSAIRRRLSLTILKQLLKDVPNIINIRVCHLMKEPNV